MKLDPLTAERARPDLHEKYCRVRNRTIARDKFYAVCADAAANGELSPEDVEVCFLRFLDEGART